MSYIPQVMIFYLFWYAGNVRLALRLRSSGLGGLLGLLGLRVWVKYHKSGNTVGHMIQKAHFTSYRLVF